MNSKSKSDVPVSITWEEDGSMTIEWDETHPVTSVLNDWTERDFVDCLINAANNLSPE